MGLAHHDSLRGLGGTGAAGVVVMLVAACLVAFAAACDSSTFVSEPPPATCSEIGAQCQLPEGPLGVCESAPCARGVAPPCLVCVSQH